MRFTEAPVGTYSGTTKLLVEDVSADVTKHVLGATVGVGLDIARSRHTDTDRYGVPGRAGSLLHGTQSLSTGRTYYFPLPILGDIVVSDIVMYVASTGTTAYFAIFECDDELTVGSKVSGSDHSFSIASTGLKTWTGLSIALNAGRYLVALSVSGTFSPRVLLPSMMGVESASFDSNQDPIVSLFVTEAAGAPAGTAWTTLVTGTATAWSMPVGFRWTDA